MPDEQEVISMPAITKHENQLNGGRPSHLDENGNSLIAGNQSQEHGKFAEGRTLRHRNASRRIIQERVRQKRQVLQDMAKPLKQWLIKHRDNPYPTKQEKITLALGSQMTLVQVSNWFANARRRLKNTVKEPDVSWAKRIKLYNSCVVGNAELLSISSDDSIWESDDEEIANEADVSTGNPLTIAEYRTNEDHSYSAPESSPVANPNSSLLNHSSWPQLCEKYHPKYKTNILQRYLHDSSEVHQAQQQRQRLSQIGGSVSSYDSDGSVSSPGSLTNSPSANEIAFKYSGDEEDKDMCALIPRKKRKYETAFGRASPEPDRRKEWDAAMALTTLAHMSREQANR